MITSPKDTVFYTIEKAIKEYKRFAFKRIQKTFNDITLDQVLLILFLHENPSLSQSEIAKIIFKDNASVTRMIELMVKNKYLKRSIDKNDRRKYKIKLTDKAKHSLNDMNKIILSNRTTAQKGIDSNDIESLTRTLDKITENCK
ncbi:MAG: MarR family transcriptional regulator [Flavobacteriaceae bacterium]|nr:MarR family transcriptional regulator [Bacteroidia bacterium]NNL16160.1 MarR family transcriptional regulator [Flavobacteriaceae bacterium]